MLLLSGKKLKIVIQLEVVSVSIFSTTSSDGEHTAEWLKKKTDSLREQILSKLPEDKREAWISQGASVLEKFGLVEESKEFANSLLQKGAEILNDNAELRRD